MKRKKSLAIALAFVLVSTVFCIPMIASAETLGSMNYTPPAGYTDRATSDDGSYVRYLLTNGSEIHVGHNVYQHGAHSVHDKTDMEWLDYIEDMFGGREKTFANMLAKFENIGGYDYVKITFGNENEGTFYYDTLYIGGPNCEYEFIYGDEDVSKPYDGLLRAVVESAQYGSSTSVTPAVNVSTDDTIKIYVDGNRIYSDADPVIISGRTLVPIRAVAEAMGCTVDWNNYTRTVRIQRGDMTVDVIVDDTTILKMWGGSFQEIHADVPATIMNGRTFVPVRAVSEAFGAKVDWDVNTKSVLIFTHGEG